MSSRLNSLALLVFSYVLSGCAETSNENSGMASASTSPAVFNSTGAPTVEFTLPDMMCEDGCAMAVKDILVRQPGAKDVAVDFDAKTATVAIDEATFDSEQAIAALVDKGFDKSTLKGDADSTPATLDVPSSQ